MSTFSYFAQNFLLPTLAAIVAGIVSAILAGGVLKWSWKRCLAVTFPVVVLAFVVSWSATWGGGQRPPLVIGGTVVDALNNEGIGQATISVSLGEVQFISDYGTEDNGNFSIDLTGKLGQSARVRIAVRKDGYRSFDGTVVVPTEGFVVVLHRL